MLDEEVILDSHWVSPGGLVSNFCVGVMVSARGHEDLW